MSPGLCQVIRLSLAILKNGVLPPALETKMLPVGRTWIPANHRIPISGRSPPSTDHLHHPARVVMPPAVIIPVEAEEAISVRQGPHVTRHGSRIFPDHLPLGAIPEDLLRPLCRIQEGRELVAGRRTLCQAKTDHEDQEHHFHAVGRNSTDCCRSPEAQNLTSRGGVLRQQRRIRRLVLLR